MVPPRRQRVDAELVRRGLAGSRDEAARLVVAGRVTCNKVPVPKPATTVTTDAALVVTADDTDPRYASRGGHKLAGALEAFMPRGLLVAGRRCLDVGASTGGFTDVLLRHGAAAVIALDVGYGQLSWGLRQDDRVQVLDRTNARSLTRELVGEPVELVVSDLSFIPLRLVLPALTAVTVDAGDLVVMVKPQFEVGPEHVGKGGVVRDPEQRVAAVAGVAETAQALGWPVTGVSTSPLAGPSGNVEFFCWMRAGARPVPPEELRAEVVRGSAAAGEKVES